MSFSSVGSFVNAFSCSLRHVGKLCLVIIFVLAPINNLNLFEQKTSEMVSLGFPAPLAPYALLASSVLSLGGAALILLSDRRLGYVLLLAFLLPVTFTMHFLPMIAEHSTTKDRESHAVHLLKNLSILGGLLLALALSGQISYLNHKLKEHQKEKTR